MKRRAMPFVWGWGLSACFMHPLSEPTTQPGPGQGEPAAATRDDDATPAQHTSTGTAPPVRARASNPAPPAPRIVSMSIKNRCPRPVQVFYGDDPQFGSGTRSRIGANTIVSKSLREGDMIWIVDEQGEPLSSWTVSAGIRRIEVLDTCTGFRRPR